MQQQENQPLSHREQRKIDQAVRLISRNDPQTDRSVSQDHRPRKIRKTTHHVQINTGPNQPPSARNEEQEQALETKSGSYLTPQHERGTIEDRNKPIDETPEMLKDPLNVDYPLKGQSVSEYLVLYEVEQQERQAGQKKQLPQSSSSSAEELVVKIDPESLKIAEKLSKAAGQFSQVVGGAPLSRRWKQFNKKWRDM